MRILKNPNDDDTFDDKFADQVGEIKHFEYESSCGQTYPGDPMIGVQLDDGKRDGFWHEELELVV